MTSWGDHVLPHGLLEALAPGLWQVTGTLKRNPLPRNMQVWRHPSGGLLLHSPICLDAPGMEHLDSLGPVRWIVAPCAFHRVDVLPYRQRYPDAAVLCPECARPKIEERAPVDGLCEDVLPDVGITVHEPAGLSPFELHFECPLEDGSKALIVTDALFNLGPQPPTGFKGLTLRLMGSVGPLGMTRLGRWLLLKDVDAHKRYVASLGDIPDLAVLCVAHGDAVHGDVRAALCEAADRL